DPDPANPDAQSIADQIAARIDRAADTRQVLRVQLQTIKLGLDSWRQYTIRFDSDRNEIAMRIGPIVNTSQLPVGGEAGWPYKIAKVKVKLNYTYESDVNVDIMSGPSFAFVPRETGVEVQFLPWHRAWSHSLTLAAFLGMVVGLIGNSVQAGLVTALAMAAHIVEDQLGYLGSNLFWPFTKDRSAGLKFIHSGDAIPNFLAVWTALCLVLFNLDRYSAPVQHRAIMLEPVSFLILALGVPYVILLSFYIAGRRKLRMRVEAARQADLIAELQETEV
ncbi:MAG TPA: metal-dependent hydrolase, partial [Anaerolineae bacterium]|nr:metal-dependent hydrolase [Anaerolineae bacterium]